MGNTVISAELLGGSKEERLAKCQKLASEAGLLAEHAANPETKRAYLHLQAQWRALAAGDGHRKVNSNPERLRELNRQMLQLSMAERRRRWTYYLAQVDSLNKETTTDDRALSYRAFYEDAVREAKTGSLETRDDFMLLASVWKDLANEFEASLANQEPNAREGTPGKLRKKAARPLGPRDQR